MDEAGSNNCIALPLEAIARQDELQSLARIFVMATHGLREPESVGVEDVRLLCEAVLRHVKPTVSTGRTKP